MRFVALFDAERRRTVCNSNPEFRVDIRLFGHPPRRRPPPRRLHGQDATIIVSWLYGELLGLCDEVRCGLNAAEML